MKKPLILLLNLFLAAYTFAQTPVSINGQLKVVGTKNSKIKPVNNYILLCRLNIYFANVVDHRVYADAECLSVCADKHHLV